MELKDFVSETIKQITDGTIEGHHHLHGLKAGRVSTFEKLTINFDVAVVTTKDSGKEGGGGISVMDFVKVGGKVIDNASESNHSRISFAIHLKMNDTAFDAPPKARITIS